MWQLAHLQIFDGVEVLEAVGLFMLDELSRFIINMGYVVG